MKKKPIKSGSVIPLWISAASPALLFFPLTVSAWLQELLPSHAHSKQEEGEGQRAQVKQQLDLSPFQVNNSFPRGSFPPGSDRWDLSHGSTRCCRGVWEVNLFTWVYCLDLWAWLCLTLCDPLDRSPTRLLCLWDFPGKNTEVGCHFLLQGTFPTQGSNLRSYISCVVGRFFITWAIGEAQVYCCWTNSVKRYLSTTNSACLTYETSILLVRAEKAPSCSRLGHWLLLFNKRTCQQAEEA